MNGVSELLQKAEPDCSRQEIVDLNHHQNNPETTSQMGTEIKKVQPNIELVTSIDRIFDFDDH